MSNSLIIGLVALIVGFGAGFFTGKSNSAKDAPAVKTEVVDPQPEKIKVTPPEAPEKKKEEIEGEATPVVNPTPPPIEPIPTKPIQPVATGNVHPPTPMDVDESRMTDALIAMAQELQNPKLWYDTSNPSLMRDCSGIFHRIKDGLQNRFNVLRAGQNFEYPDVKTARSSRQIARWYHERGNLKIVKDPMAARNSIRPGSVMFFGKSLRKGEKVDRQNLTLDRLTLRGPNLKRHPSNITHVGVVIQVHKDDDGNVIGYEMMHARSGGKDKGMNYARPSGHMIDKAKKGNRPILGNWNQEWVAVANIVTEKKS